jgi:hypothetical protein
MTAMILLSILGQCSGGSCPAPARFVPSSSGRYSAPAVIDGPVYVPTVRVVDQPASLPLKAYEIKHDGLRFTVLGVKLANGVIDWNPSLRANKKAYWEAKWASEKLPTARIGVDPTETKPAIQNYGLRPDKMGRKPEAYTAGSAEAQRFVQESKGEAGEAGKLHVTVIGSEADCAPVVGDLKSHPALAGVRERLMIQDYRPNEWPVSPSLGFQVNGKPTILIQSARGPGDAKGGRVVYRAMDYTGGAERLAEEIRKADPRYNPSLDPGPGRSGRGECPLGFNTEHWPAIFIVGVGILLVILNPKRRNLP